MHLQIRINYLEVLVYFVQLFRCVVEYAAEPLLLEGIVLGSQCPIFKLLGLELLMALLMKQFALIDQGWVDLLISGGLPRAARHLHSVWVWMPR